MESIMKNEVEELLSKANNSFATYYMRFERLTGKFGIDSIYCFVEGYDMPYYISRVREITGVEPQHVECNGKKNVKGIYQYISQKVDCLKYKKMFFVDRDFDDNSTISENIYITPCYSIENLYLSEKSISRIINIEYKLDPVEDEKYQKVTTLFSQELEKFHNEVLLFNSWYACLKEKLTEGEKSISLDDKFPSDFLHLEISNISSSYDLNTIKQKFPSAKDVTVEEIIEKQAHLSSNMTALLRGKYEIQFLGCFLEYLNVDSRTDQTYTKQKSSINVNIKQLISQFSQYADTPQCLRNYIIENSKITA